MNQSVKWSLLGLLAYVIFLLIKLPANQLISRITLPPQMSISGVDGTIWDGNASSVIFNNIEVENVHWDTSFWRLLTGQLVLDLDAGNARSSDQVSFDGNIAVSLFNTKHIQADNFVLYLPANMVIAQINLPVSVDAAGRFKVEIEQLDYPGQCESLAGKGQWINAGMEGLGEPLSLGNFDADLSCIETDTLISVKEPNSFGLSAQTRVTQDLQFSVDGKFKPDESLPKQVKDAALFFGQPDPQGYYKISL